MNAKVDDKQALREEISQYLDTLANRVWKACLGRRGWKDTDIENDIIALIDAYTEQRLKDASEKPTSQEAVGGKQVDTVSEIGKYTQEQLDTMAALQTIGAAITNMEVPRNVKRQKKIAEARKYAAQHLHDLGYSHRQIAEVLGLASPQSISVYLNLDADTTGSDLVSNNPKADDDLSNPPESTNKQGV